MKIKSGSTRWVILVYKYAIKIPSLYSWKHFLWGLLGNIQENIFSGLDDKICPVIFSLPGGFLNVMMRCESITKEQFNLLNYEEWIKIDNGIIPVENKQSSFGILNNKIVAIDYGS